MIGGSYIPLYQANVNATYQAGSAPFDPSKPWEYRCAVGPHAEDLAAAYIKQDWRVVGKVLGYPECCVDFFMEYWVKEQWFDTTYPMGKGDILSPANNILLRWMGIRLVSHLPCSFSCFKTAIAGAKNIELARELGYGREIGNIVEMLNWPMEWTSLHGIAIITTPVFKIITATDALPSKASFRLEGLDYPKEGASGLVFPFTPDRDKKRYIDNGFPSRAAMDAAHDKVIKDVSDLKPSSVLDLGCGNRELLNKMSYFFGAYGFGVDIDPDKLPDACMNLYDFEFHRDFDLVLVAEQRIQENPEAFAGLLDRIQKHAKHLHIYNYNK
jgi:hypothetical protein